MFVKITYKNGMTATGELRANTSTHIGARFSEDTMTPEFTTALIDMGCDVSALLEEEWYVLSNKKEIESLELFKK